MGELLLAAGLLTAGYVLAGDGKTNRTSVEHFAPASGNLVTQDTALFDQRFKDSLDPARTGIIAPGRLWMDGKPQFRSEAAMHSNDAFKNRKLETFSGGTGNDPCTQDPGSTLQRQVTPLFAPQPTTTPMMQETGDRGLETERYKTGLGRMNNVVPVAPIRVGPGLNAPADVQAQGAFHQFFRVMPENINAHRLNRDYMQQPIPGKAPVGKRAADVAFAQNKPTHNIHAQEPMRNSAAVKALVARGSFTNQQPIVEGASTLRLPGAYAPAGGRLDVGRRGTRDRPGRVQLGVAHGTNAYPVDQRYGGIRKMVASPLQGGGFSSGVSAPANRSLRYTRMPDHIAITGAAPVPTVRGGTVPVRNQSAKPTNKQDLLFSSVGSVTGGVKGGFVPQILPDSRVKTSGDAHTPGACAKLPNYSLGTVEEDTVPREQPAMVPAAGIHHSGIRAPEPQVTKPKVSLQLPPQDFGIVKEVLRGNPYLH